MNIESKINRVFTALDEELGKHEPDMNRITLSMTSLQRLMTDLQQKAQMEMQSEKREDLKRKHQQFQERLENYKAKTENAKRSLLLSPVPQQQDQLSPSPTTNTPLSIPTTPNYAGMTTSGLREREKESIHRSITMVDGYIDQASASITKLRDQDRLLKASHKRLLDAANTLGLSQDVIRWIERRSIQDMYIFWGGVLVISLMFIVFLIYK